MNLEEWLFYEKITNRAFAEQLGIHRCYLQNFVLRRKHISKKLADKIERLTGGQVKASEFRTSKQAAEE